MSSVEWPNSFWSVNAFPPQSARYLRAKVWRKRWMEVFSTPRERLYLLTAYRRPFSVSCVFSSVQKRHSFGFPSRKNRYSSRISTIWEHRGNGCGRPFFMWRAKMVLLSKSTSWTRKLCTVAARHPQFTSRLMITHVRYSGKVARLRLGFFSSFFSSASV